MSVELLRRAAALLRKRAEPATRERWHVHVAGTGIRSSVPYAFVTTTPPGTVGPIAAVMERHNGGTVADVEYVATVDPVVGLALADWLDATAHALEHGFEGAAEYGADADAYDAIHGGAVALARAVLRESDEGSGGG